MTIDITKIWAAVLAGDVTAWRQLVNLYAGLVFSVARRVGLREEDAEDCSQQVWLTLYRRRKTINDPAAIPAWLATTTHRKALNIVRKTTPENKADLLESIADPEALQPDTIAALEQMALLESAMRKLDKRCQELINELFFVQPRKSYDSIARKMGIKPNSIGPARSRCLNKLKEILKKMEVDWD